jgi:hypothetical protein
MITGFLSILPRELLIEIAREIYLHDYTISMKLIKRFQVADKIREGYQLSAQNGILWAELCDLSYLPNTTERVSVSRIPLTFSNSHVYKICEMLLDLEENLDRLLYCYSTENDSSLDYHLICQLKSGHYVVFLTQQYPNPWGTCVAQYSIIINNLNPWKFVNTNTYLHDILNFSYMEKLYNGSIE